MISSHLCFCLVRSISCAICSNTGSVRRHTSSFQNRRTVYPQRRREALRCASWTARSMCCPPSTAITSFGSSAQKSTTYDPMGCWRRNLTPLSCRARRSHQRRPSASLCCRRRVRAVRVEICEVFAGSLATVVEAAQTQTNKEGGHLIPSPGLSRRERSTGPNSMPTAERPNPSSAARPQPGGRCGVAAISGQLSTNPS